jgi:cysteinyl-tRNA synthetase
MTNKVERLVPIHDDKINLFVCGPTVYGLAHVGNGKTFTQFDMVAKYLRYKNLDVFYLQNITDIDDKIIKISQERGTSWKKIADLYTRKFLQDMKSLGNDAVSQYAKATDYISQIVDQVKTQKLGQLLEAMRDSKVKINSKYKLENTKSKINYALVSKNEMRQNLIISKQEVSSFVSDDKNVKLHQRFHFL